MDDCKKVEKSILSQYMGLFEKPTIVQLSKDSRIQKTRLFRLMNGIDMKLSEYLILKNRISALTNSKSNIELVAKECELKLSAQEVLELSKVMNRKLRQRKLEISIQEFSIAA